MKYLGGVEISISWAGQTIHIVGLGINPHNEQLVEGLRKTRDGRTDRGRAIAAQLGAVGIENSYEGALTYAGNPELLSRTHFARFLVQEGICKNTEDVFKNYLVEGKPGYIPHLWATLEESVTWIKDAGGVAVIAHPGRYKLTELQKHALYEEFKEDGGLAIEVVTGSHTPAQFEEYAKIALKYGFLASRGSDFHDPAESFVDLGTLPQLHSSLKPVWSLFQL